ncbi:MAG: NADH:flavin oxidoreductase, partial [Acidobacteria bacterium]|nr:NADH:flavin oxidoreductase [Acidobacteriota bacterium]
MPRGYFHYRSLEELDGEARQFKLDLRLEPDARRVSSLLGRPVRIGHYRAGNSLAIHPMEGCDGTPLGEPDELTFRRYDRFARGGA